MALGMADVRWRSRRDPEGGPPLFHVAFIEDGEERRIAAAVAGIARYVASLTGRPRREYDPDVPAEIAGDRRLGHGLAAVCLEAYQWTARTFAEALPAHVADALVRAGIENSVALRLRLFDLVNEAWPGFVPTGEREAALARLAGQLGFTPADAAALDLAMTLDAEAESILTPLISEMDETTADESAPSDPREPAAIVSAYNRALLAAALRQAERIVFTVREPTGGLVRRLYAQCRALGVYCDVEQAGELTETFRLTLSGPDAVVGPPAAAGPRLASVALRMLRRLGPHDSGNAFLVLQERRYRMVLDSGLLRVPGLADLQVRLRLRDRETNGAEDRHRRWLYRSSVYQVRSDSAPQADRPGNSGEEDRRRIREAGAAAYAAGGAEEEPARYDSEVEARLAREFAALRRQGRAAGWTLEREPAPLVAGRRVLIPDFALVRGSLRVFVEVVGFWTPGYLARKRAGLEQVAPDVPLVLAASTDAAALLDGLPFPVVPFKESVAVPRLLEVAEGRFGDFARRTADAGERLAMEYESRQAEGWIAEERLAAVLGCHSPGEAARVLADLALPSGWQYVPGAGLCGPALMDAVTTALTPIWHAEGSDARLSLARLRGLLTDRALPDRDDALVLILERSAACTVLRSSLFDVELAPPGAAAPDWQASLAPAAGGATARARAARPRRASPPDTPPLFPLDAGGPPFAN